MRDLRYKVQPTEYSLRAIDFNLYEDLKVAEGNFINVDYKDIDLKSYFKIIEEKQVQVIFIIEISNDLYEYKAEYLANFELLEEMSKDELKRMLSSIVFFYMYKESRDLVERTLTEALKRKVILPFFDYNKLQKSKAD